MTIKWNFQSSVPISSEIRKFELWVFHENTLNLLRNSDYFDSGNVFYSEFPICMWFQDCRCIMNFFNQSHINIHWWQDITNLERISAPAKKLSNLRICFYWYIAIWGQTYTFCCRKCSHFTTKKISDFIICF